MRITFIALLIVALPAVGVYATSGDPEVSAALGEDSWGCTGVTAVNPPTHSPITLGLELNKSGDVTGAKMSWTPAEYGEYTLSTNLEASAGLLQVSHSGDTSAVTSRVHLVRFPSPIPAALVELSSVSVAQRLDQGTNLAVAMGWLIDSSGRVTQAQVMWEPQADSDYELLVTLGSSGGSLLVQDPDVGTRNDMMSLTPAVAGSLSDGALKGLLSNPNVTAIKLDGHVQATDAELDAAWGVARIGSGGVHTGGNKGNGIKVTLIDSGMDYTHPDLGDNYAGGYDFVNGDFDPMDDAGHGTHVAVAVGAEDNDSGVVGVAPEASLYAIKVLNSSGRGSWSGIIAALQWAVDNGIQVTNNSFGSGTNPGGVVQAAYDNSAAAGIIHVASGGNSGNPRGKGNNVGYSVGYASVIAVAATDPQDRRASFSSTGDTVEVPAPGVTINSTRLGGGYIEFNGTSMASPHVAGVTPPSGPFDKTSAGNGKGSGLAK